MSFYVIIYFILYVIAKYFIRFMSFNNDVGLKVCMRHLKMKFSNLHNNICSSKFLFSNLVIISLI